MSVTRAASTSLSSDIVGTSAGFRKVLARAARVAQYPVPVLIRGESGTGKEILARLVHAASQRAGGPLVTVNCAAIPRELLEAELFGSEKGAFTGAGTRLGAFELAHGGTLFLDEVGDLALDHQAKLLRAIQQGEVQRVGGTVRHVDVRLITATHRDLRQRAAAGEFREDLFHRLVGYELHLPPLRERGRDILAIARRVLERTAAGKFFTRPAQQLLLAYPWPGNVRELENVVRAVAIETGGRRISDAAVQRHFQGFPVSGPRPVMPGADDAVRELLEQTGRVTPAALRARTGLAKTSAHRLLADMQRDGRLSPRGCGRGTYYVAVSPKIQATPAPSTRQQDGLRLAREQGRLLRQEYERLAGVTSRTAKRDLADLVDRGLLCLAGRGKAAACVPALAQASSIMAANRSAPR